MKYSLDTNSIRSDHEAFNFERVRRHIELNQAYCFKRLGYVENTPSRTIFDPKKYAFDGSLWVTKQHFDSAAPEFLKRSRRSVTRGGRVYLRGTRYTISSNPTFEVRQKLDDLVKDFQEGLIAIQSEKSLEFVLAIADYVKNVAITLLNSLIAGEKIGKFGFTNSTYQSLRRDAQAISQSATDMFYGIMFGTAEVYNNAYSNLMVNGEQVVQRIEDRILHDYREGSFSSRHITRPEASHPLIIGGFALRLALDKRLVPDTILGMPAGATELALATHAAFKFLRRIEAPVLLFPASLHSVKHDFDNAHGHPEYIDALVDHHRTKLRDKRVLVVDDNSSTGKTLQIVTSKIQTVKPRALRAYVAEADIVRTQLRQAEKSKVGVASPACYTMSLNVLPVSRSLLPKFDLKQLNERRRMITCVKDRYLSCREANPIRRIMGHLYVDLIKKPNFEMTGINEISSFRKTFLSNFAQVEVALDGSRYNSVEHAYQRAKLTNNALDSLGHEHLRIINKKLEQRGASIEKHDVLSFFSNPELDAGTSKIVGNQLRILGFVRPDWDHIKLPIMIFLLLQKFSDQTFYDLLSQTEQKVLIEGNDWHDTFWGVCDGRGRNVLGRLLMKIRSFSRGEISSFVDDSIVQGIPNYT